MRALVTGAAGQLGRELVRTMAEAGNEAGPVAPGWAAARVDAVDRGALDIADGPAVDAWFAEHGPYDVVFNCAALTDVDGCETAREAAFAANAEGPGNLARACAAAGAVLVHVSTDYVFSGDEPGARREGDPCAPASVYGASKLAGERAALAANPATHVVRTAWLYGRGGGNFVRTMMRLGASRDEVAVVDDQVGNPTSAADLAREMLRIAGSGAFGVWHATCEGECSWADLAEAVMDEAGLPCRVRRCSSAEWRRMNPGAAARPAHSSLENGRLRATIGSEMRPWREALASFVARERAEAESEEGRNGE